MTEARRSNRPPDQVLRGKALLSGLLELPKVMSAVALFALMAITFADVLLRSILNAPLQAGADLTRLLMAITIFSVLPVLSWQGGHISVDLLDGLIKSQAAARLRAALIDLLCSAMLLWPAYQIGVLAERSRSYGDVMEYLGISIHYATWFIAGMTALTALALLIRAVQGVFLLLSSDQSP